MIILTKLNDERIAINIRFIIDVQEYVDHDCLIYYNKSDRVFVKENFDVIMEKLNDS